MIKKNCFFAKHLVLKAEFLKKILTDWHESSRCCCHTITRSRLRSFSVVGDVSLTLFAFKSPKTLLWLKRIVSLLNILSWKPSFSKKSGRLTRCIAPTSRLYIKNMQIDLRSVKLDPRIPNINKQLFFFVSTRYLTLENWPEGRWRNNLGCWWIDLRRWRTSHWRNDRNCY